MEGINNVTEMDRHQDHILFSTNNGLLKLQADETIEKINLSTDKILINLLGISKKNEIFVAIQGEGIKVLNENYEIIEHYNKEHGLKQTNIYSLEFDADENIWSGTSNGLLYINRKKKISTYYDQEKGVGQNDFNYQSSCKAKDGTMFFGGINRLINFHPNSILAAEKLDKVNLVDVFNRKRNSNNFTPIYDSTQLILSMEYPELKLVFGSSNPLGRSEKNLMYQIDNSKWQALEGGEVTLKELNPGAHQVNVKNKYNDDNVFTTTVSSRFQFPGNTTYWFLLLLITSLLIYIYNFFKRKRLIKDNLILEQQVSERTQEINHSNSELKKSNDTKDKIFSVLAHDLISPVNSLLNLTDTVKFLIEKDRYDDLLLIGKDIQKKTNNLKTLIDNLLHWSLQQQDKTYLTVTKFKILGPIGATIKLFQSQCEEKKLTINTEVPVLHTLISDYAAFEIIIRNLLYNAIKYSYTGGTIYLTSHLSNNDRELTVTIRDEGVGLNEEQLSMFEEGSYNSTTGPYKEKGTGIGLTLSKHFAEKMGGKISLFSKENKGCTATLTLPLKPAEIS